MLAKSDKSTAEDGKTTRTLVQEALGLLPPGASPDDVTLSGEFWLQGMAVTKGWLNLSLGKLIALAALLKQMRQV